MINPFSTDGILGGNRFDTPKSQLAPIGLALGPKDSLLYVSFFLSREIGVYDVSGAKKYHQYHDFPRVALYRSAKGEPLSPKVLTGKQVFWNAGDKRMTQEAISCVVCHPDGGSDGRVHDLTVMQEGLRKTHTLLGRGGTDHGMIHHSGNFDEVQDFEIVIRHVFDGKGFIPDSVLYQQRRFHPLGGKTAGLSEDLDALAAFLKSLKKVPPSPYRNQDGTMTAEAKAGKKIFMREDVGCATCHTPPKFTDSRLQDPIRHNVGTLNPSSGERLGESLDGFDTPTLKGVWQERHFLHDGSAKTLREVLLDRNPNDLHGKTSHLSEEEISQLIAFLMQLDDEDPYHKLSKKSNKDQKP